MKDTELIKSQAEYLRRQASRSHGNALLWSTVHNVTGVSGCLAPFLLFGMYHKFIPHSPSLTLSLLLA